ncbi:CCNDBP1 [Acanthosepion pharaonis]|uniref:CCNDBP1 n=1 Tax=Acanthosepion pharaonis TaxID=158019 RepID=A0A812CI05_ACAPH|nr:CCNDBP1 [Sepia pharaonis]
MADYPHSENVFNDVVDNLGLVISQLQDGESQQTDNSNYEKVAYWDRIEKISQSLSHEVTIISMAFSKSPYPSPENVRKMLSKLETASLALVSNFYSLPKSQGLLLRDSFKKSTLDLITKVQTFVKSIQTGMASSPEMLQKTGVVWEHSDYFSNLPKDNKRAVIELMTWSLGLLLDALRELEETMAGGGQFDDLDDLIIESGQGLSNEDEWSEEDRTLLGPCQGLIKVANYSLKKAMKATEKGGHCDTFHQISEYDDMADHIKKLSPAVDQLGIALYPPMRHRLVRAYAEHLAEILRNFLNCLGGSHITCEDDMEWLNYLHKAIEHNMEKIHTLTNDK